MIKYVIEIQTDCQSDDVDCHDIKLDVGVSLSKAYEVFQLIANANRFTSSLNYIRLCYMVDGMAHILAFKSNDKEW